MLPSTQRWVSGCPTRTIRIGRPSKGSVGSNSTTDPTYPTKAVTTISNNDFLHSLADKYEMHVYTMGTRAYADAVCKIIDPTGEIFGNRILSRDESGSMTQKSITRLFPVDTSMVVIIDDRGDVWEYSPNLVSVLPYNFFVGIGDINGAFLPPARPLEPPPTETEAPAPTSTEQVEVPVMTVTDDSGSTSSLTKGESPTTAVTDASSSGATSEMIASAQACETSAVPVSCSAINSPSPESASPSAPNTQEEMAKTARSKLIADQVLTRPLKQKQIALQQEAQRGHHKSGSHRRSNNSSVATRGSQNGGSSTASKSASSSRATTPVVPLLTPSSDFQSNDPAHHRTSQSSSSPDPETSTASIGQPTQPGSQIESIQATKTAPIDLESSASSSDSDTNTDLSLDDDVDFDHPLRPEQAVLVDRDNELSRLKLILGDIHSGFYSQDSIEEADARAVISAIKHDVLHGLHLAFSSLWPMEAVSEQQYAWKLAEQFGARCYTHLSPKVTHLIAAKLGTSKVNLALSRPNVSIVRPKWLYDAALLWTRPSEAGYSWRGGTERVVGSTTERLEGVGIEEEEEGVGVEDEGIQEEWGMAAADWKEATAEVMAALDETDDDEEESVDGHRSSESDEPGRGRKRTRTSSSLPSPTRSRSGDRLLLEPKSESDRPTDEVDSPLSKRKRIARSRSSKLKLVVPLIEDHPQPSSSSSPPHHTNPQSHPLSHPTTSASSSSSASTSLDRDHQFPALHSRSNSKSDQLLLVDQLSAEDDEFLSALAAEMEGNMNN
ncbi:hypothetical protein PGT21_020504 [Puccinia graminis f. sp. tritici]|uniref:protein-serine/threonine phosphatase n=1 Tax=Puccinia graminis f. sp. tritici TaxID=56615 RepID=A0A5B0RHJ4_PUCGR|nr:hypothetical protein PGT21_020504 [Puccinia graminis f. sp. tritici]KAA1125391.1 hypothetical protein PGTUg99_000809 [Puccinia graminis f. sp. tritici]